MSEKHISVARETFLDRLIIKFGNILSLLFMFGTLIIIFEIIMRKLFDAPTVWVHETTVLVCSLCFAYGGNYCLAKDKHIRIVVLYDHVSPAVKRWLDVFTSFFGLIFSIMLAWGAWMMTKKALFAPWGDLRLETSGSAWNPPFPAISKSFLLIILCIMIVQFALHLIRDLQGPSIKKIKNEG